MRENHWKKLLDENFKYIPLDPLMEYPNPDANKLVIGLHAYQYESPDFNLVTHTLPKWTDAFEGITEKAKVAKENIMKVMKK